MTGWRTWREATQAALYGPDGFYRRPGAPAAHYRTSAHATTFAAALARLARSCGLDTIVDVGAGGGQLLGALHRVDRELRLIGVEVAARPPGLPSVVDWTSEIPQADSTLLVANEWLDNVPVEVVESTSDGWRTVLVDPASGEERLGPAPDAADLAWLDRWWPGLAPGGRAEVGRPRDEAWAAAVGRLRRGLAVAIDYGHLAGARPPYGTLTGYRDGRQVGPVPDGSCDITAHVAVDACAEQVRRATGAETLVTSQRCALRALGVQGARPPISLAGSDPRAYLDALVEAGQAGELLDPAGLGGFCWLVHAIRITRPTLLADLYPR